MALIPWQDRLSTYQTDQDAAIKELLRTKGVAEARVAQGLDIIPQKNWANQIRAAAGLGAEYGPGVTAGQAKRNYGSFQRENQISDMLASLSKSSPTFTARDAERSPEYKAAQQLAEKLAKRDVATTAEQLNALGIANSSSMGTGASRINEAASDKLAAMIPGIIQNRLAQYNQERANQLGLLNALAGLQSGERQTGIQEAGLTGQYQGNPTLEAQIQAEKQRQYEASPEMQDWYLPLSKQLLEAQIANQQRSAAAPYSTGGGTGAITGNATGDAMDLIDQAYAEGYTDDQVMELVTNATPQWTRDRVNLDAINKYVESKRGLREIAQDTAKQADINTYLQEQKAYNDLPWWKRISATDPYYARIQK